MLIGGLHDERCYECDGPAEMLTTSRAVERLATEGLHDLHLVVARSKRTPVASHPEGAIMPLTCGFSCSDVDRSIRSIQPIPKVMWSTSFWGNQTQSDIPACESTYVVSGNSRDQGLALWLLHQRAWLWVRPTNPSPLRGNHGKYVRNRR